MSFKNSLKLTASNFGVVWKHLVYVFIVSLLTIGLVVAFATPSINVLKDSGWIDKVSGLISTIYTESRTIYGVIKEIVTSLFVVLGDNFTSIWYSIIGLVITGYLIPAFLINLGNYNLASITQNQMTSLLSVGYTQNFISNIGAASKFSLVRTLFKIPFDFIKVFIIVLLFNFSTTFITKLLFLFLMFALVILITSAELTLFAGFAPTMIERGGNPFKCLFRSMVPILRNFAKTFSNAIIILITCILINGFLGLFTVFSGLLVTVPATFVFIAYFGNVVYLSLSKKRYYLSPSIIVNPNIEDNKPFENK